LAQPGLYNEIGLKFPDDASLTVYIGKVEIFP